MRDFEEAVREMVRENAASWLLNPATRDQEMLRLVGDIAAQMYHHLKDVAHDEWLSVKEPHTREIYSQLIKRVSK